VYGVLPGVSIMAILRSLWMDLRQRGGLVVLGIGQFFRKRVWPGTWPSSKPEYRLIMATTKKKPEIQRESSESRSIKVKARGPSPGCWRQSREHGAGRHGSPGFRIRMTPPGGGHGPRFRFEDRAAGGLGKALEIGHCPLAKNCKGGLCDWNGPRLATDSKWPPAMLRRRGCFPAGMQEFNLVGASDPLAPLAIPCAEEGGAKAGGGPA
jgi:hypothetical protein